MEKSNAPTKKLSLRFHPNVSKAADAGLRILEINEDYQILNDPTLINYKNILCLQAILDIHGQVQDSLK